jgi:hypothetical protein
MSDIFITSSLPLAAYLVASKELQLHSIKLTDPRRGAFVFDDPQHRGRELESHFIQGHAVVVAINYHHQLRILRRSLDEKLYAARSGVNEQNQSLGKENVSYVSQR